MSPPINLSSNPEANMPSSSSLSSSNEEDITLKVVYMN
jgi:hypothetical protein